MPEPTRQYIFTERQIKLAFGAVTGLMVLSLSALLLLITARPQGAFGEADTSRFEGTLAAAAAELQGYREQGDGLLEIDIDHAIELVAERGVADPFTAVAGAGQQAQGAAGAGAEEGGAALPDGAQVYTSCAVCHQANGQGVPGAFPPLAGHAADLYEADPSYLAQVVLFGLEGAITVDGAQYASNMPAWQASLSDAQIAAVLNHILSLWGNEEVVGEEQPYSAEEIAEQRTLGLGPQDVYARRAELELP
jgi:mono/diheme cytochrome c family protein